MSIQVGAYAYYKGEKGCILWLYDNGQCEFEFTHKKINRVDIIDYKDLISL